MPVPVPCPWVVLVLVDEVPVPVPDWPLLSKGIRLRFFFLSSNAFALEEATADILPVADPKQVASDFDGVTVIAGPGLTVAGMALLTQPAASVTTMLYEFAARPVNTVLAVPVCVVVPFNTKVYGPPPLEGVTVICPLLAPLQVVLTMFVPASNAEPCGTLILLNVPVHPMASVTTIE